MIVVKRNGTVMAALIGVSAAAIRDHLLHGYSDLLQEFDAGQLVVETVADPVSPTPAEVLAAETAEREAQEFSDAVLRVVAKVAFNHENRLRAQEGKAAITAAQFRAAIRTLT